MKLPTKITKTKVSIDQFEEKLVEKHGYVAMDNGHFATIYGIPGYEKVLKVARFDSVDEDGYLSYLQAMNPKNPLLPRIYSIKFYSYGSRKYYVIEMERLFTLECVSHKEFCGILSKLKLTYVSDIIQRTPKSASVRKMQKILKKLLCTFENDLGGENVMLRKLKRGYSLVVTDPIA